MRVHTLSDDNRLGPGLILRDGAHWITRATDAPVVTADSMPGPVYVFNSDELCALLDEAYHAGEDDEHARIAERLTG